MTTINKIYLDMDGVIADFVTAACGIHGRKVPDPWPPGECDIAKVLGMTPKQFWGPVDDASHDWWAEMPKTKEFKDIETLLARINLPVTIVSTPRPRPNSWGGKFEWVKIFKPTRSFATPSTHFCWLNKWELSQPGRLLIGDSDIECELWRDNGGTAILLPRPWNAGHEVSHAPIGTLCHELAQLGL